MNKESDTASITRWHYYRREPQLFAQLPQAWQLSIKQHYDDAMKRQRLRQRHRALPISILASLVALTATKAKSAPTVYTNILTGTSSDTAYNTSTDTNGNLVYHFASGDSISTTGVGTENTFGVDLQTNSPKVILQAGAGGAGQLSISTLRPDSGTYGVATAINVQGGASLTVNGNTSVYAQSNDAVPNSSSVGVNVYQATATFNGTTSIVTYTPGYSKGLQVYQGQVTFNGDTSITAQARGSSTDAIYNSGGGRSSIVMNGNVTLVSYGIWPSDDVHGIYNDNVNSKLAINGNLLLTATSNGSTVMGIRNQGNLSVTGNASITASGPRSAFGIDNTFRTSRLYVGGDLTVSVTNTTGYIPFGTPTGLSNLYGMGSSMTYGGTANVSVTAVTDSYAINNNGVISFTNADKTTTLRASTSCSTCDVYGIANSGGSITLAGGLDVAESSSGTGHLYAIWNAATDGDSAQLNVNQAGNQSVKIVGDVLTGSVTDGSNAYSGVTTLNFDDSASYLKGLVLGDSGSSGNAVYGTGTANLSFAHGASWIPTGAGTLVTDFGSGSLTVGTGSTIDMAASWGSFSADSIPSYSLRTLQIGSSASGGASVNLADGAVFTLLSDIRNDRADEVVFGSSITSFKAQGTLGIRIAYDPVLNSTSWVNTSTLQNGTTIEATKPIVIIDASTADGGNASFQTVQGLTSQWSTTYENALVRFSYVPNVSVSSNHKEVLLTGINIIGNGSGSSGSTTSTSSGSDPGNHASGSTTSHSGTGNSNSTGSGSASSTGNESSLSTTGSEKVPLGVAAVITPSTGVMVAADAARVLSNIWQVDDEPIDRRSESLRLDEDANASALWVDTNGGSLQGSTVDGRTYRQSETSVSIGADRRTNVDLGYNTTGLVYTHDQSHADLQNGTADLQGSSVGLYSTWVSNQGMFADVVARVGQLRNSYVSTDSFGTSSGRYRPSSSSLSVRAGKRFRGEHGRYIEPQVQAAYGSMGSSSYSASNDVRFDVNKNHTFFTRAGVLAGQTFSLSTAISGDVYARASMIHTVGDRPNLTASMDGGSLPVVLPVRHATTGELAAGGQIELQGQWRAFAEVDRASRTDAVAGGWRVSAGLRYSF
ncbi:autotransporter outer membrane beta-barrel domain-containing protein [Dyella caseinilytica]|uniref:Autotransporter outer membrane beta-barrel domain-containing protein n=1 Tax=Dyella caseinilytica TaxID=1849581 RepID=A0ABX7GYL5_9GAMM|nr:autotransporter outer membrane beta-barrel domain-containing protein [Dyella caseinilytica]QRN55600.1 autotransporter outer membrane beta-barrel domain-containing protein [Dyella caseinilytica]